MDEKKKIGYQAPEYKSPYDEKLQSYMDRIESREPFKYDLNNDAFYDMYKNQAVAQGQKAMMDTMGQTTALTGGYGNTYAQQAGQQAYQGYLLGLNDKIPELYNLALNRYNSEGADLRDKAGLVAGMADRDYDRFMQGDKLAYDRTQDSYNKLMALMTQFGYKPTQEELDAAGIPAGVLDRIQQTLWAPPPVSSGRGGGGGGGGYAPAGGLSIKELYWRGKESGASTRDQDALLREGVASGEISEWEAKELRENPARVEPGKKPNSRRK